MIHMVVNYIPPHLRCNFYASIACVYFLVRIERISLFSMTNLYYDTNVCFVQIGNSDLFIFLQFRLLYE
jgi:hypothetical protein